MQADTQADTQAGTQASPSITTRMLTRLGPSPSLTLLSLDRSQPPPRPRPGHCPRLPPCGVGPIPVASSGLHSRRQGPAVLSPLPAPAHQVQGLHARCSVPGDSLRAGQAPAAPGTCDEPGPLLQETRGRLGEHCARGWPALSCGLFPSPSRPPAPPKAGCMHCALPPAPGAHCSPQCP